LLERTGKAWHVSVIECLETELRWP